MALTSEERLAKLKQHENWWSFTDAQRQFLAYMASGDEPLEAAKRAYPECKNAVVMTKSMMARVGIQSALESIGLDRPRPDVSRKEALKQLSRFMRLAKDATEYCKVFAHYSKLQGWDVSGEENVEEAVSLDQLVAAMEKKRKKV